MRPARACADSSAGMMPSVRARRLSGFEGDRRRKRQRIRRGVRSASQACSGPIGRIIESGGNGMGGGDLAVFVLQDVGVGALQDAGRAPVKP